MNRSEAILRALDESTTPQTPDEIAAGIGAADEGKYVGQLMCSLRIKGHAESVERRGRALAWIITEQGREFLTDLLAEQQDGDASPTSATRRVLSAESARRDPDGPLPARAARRGKATSRANGASPFSATMAAPVANLTAAPDQDIAVRSDGAVLVIEGSRIVFTLSPALALNVAAVVRRLRAEAP